MSEMTVKAPWLAAYSDVPSHLEYSKLSMSAELGETVKKYPNYIAYEFMGKKTTYKKSF